MNIQSFENKLEEVGIEKNEAKKEVSMLLEHFCNYTSLDTLRGRELTQEELDLVAGKVDERKQTRKPIQYVIGEAYFMGNFFKVNESVLIPRDETEILVTEVIKKINENNLKNILDIGSGSGCIACSIAQKTHATVLGVDISTDALMVALDNVTKLNLNNKAIFRKSDLFSKIREDEKFDLIVSNPPYIPQDEILEKEVLKEPHLALFAPNNGLYFYEEIIKQSPKYLNKNGFLAFEMGVNQSEYIYETLNKHFTNIEIIKDLAGIDRVIIGQLK